MEPLIVAGLVLIVIGNLWFAVLAFQEGLLWGLGTLCLPFVGLVFAFNRWDITKRPLLISVVGGVLAFIGVIFSAPLQPAGT
jgi:uncharacterized membrane protein